MDCQRYTLLSQFSPSIPLGSHEVQLCLCYVLSARTSHCGTCVLPCRHRWVHTHPHPSIAAMFPSTGRATSVPIKKQVGVACQHVPRPHLSPQSGAMGTRAEIPQQVLPQILWILLQQGTGKDSVWERILQKKTKPCAQDTGFGEGKHALMPPSCTSGVHESTGGQNTHLSWGPSPTGEEERQPHLLQWVRARVQTQQERT